MDNMLYTAMTGAKNTMTAQSIHAHNLANVSTTGFKSDFAQARAMTLFGDGHPSRVFALTETPGMNLESGPIMSTNNDLDVAVAGKGWIAVQAEDGSEAYTRSGDFRISANGMLINGQNLPVLGNSGPIVIPPSEKLDIAQDGTITIRALGQPATTLTEINRIKLVNPSEQDLFKGVDGLLHRKDGEIEAADSSISVVSGSLEGSNVNAVEALVDILALTRQFEMQVKLMQTAETNDEASARIMQLS